MLTTEGKIFAAALAKSGAPAGAGAAAALRALSCGVAAALGAFA
jgi:hypothetical protein